MWSVGPKVQVVGAELVGGYWILSAVGSGGRCCPSCGIPSTTRRSWHARQLQDLPAQGVGVTVKLQLGRWRCRNRQCKRQTFVERPSAIAAPFARRTRRVLELVLPMATRSGDVPPDLLFWLLRNKPSEAATLEKTLYQESGLLGLSGTSGDMRVLQDSKDSQAVAAVVCFVYALTKFAGAYVAVLGGLDALVFTAGIGEHSVQVRAALCSKLAWLNLKLDEQANKAGGPRISAPDSAVSVWVIPTNEELMIAQHTLALLRR